MFSNGFPKEWSTLRKLAWLYRTVINAVSAVLKTVVGNPIHILDALAKPAQALSVKLEPIQDLHGYDNPWPAGGGTNKIAWEDGIDFTLKDLRYYVTDGKLYVNGTSTGETSSADAAFETNFKFTLKAGSYYFTRMSESLPTYLIHYVDGVKTSIATNSGAFTLAQDEEVWVGFYVYNKTFNNEHLSIQIVSGSTEPTVFAPYSNECPIYGHTDADVTRTGAILFSKSDATPNRYLDSNGIEQPSSSWYISDYMPVSNALTYMGITTPGQAPYSCWYDANKNFVSSFKQQTGANTITPPSNAKYVRFSINATGDINSFKAYDGYETYPIPLGQTVYGGVVEWIGGDKWRVTSYPYYASYNGETLVGPWISSMDKYEAGATPTTGAQVVDFGGTPTTFTITTTELFSLLQGENNLFSDGTMTLVYLADGNASDVEALNILLGGRYVNNHGEDEPTDREALQILLGGQR